MELKKLGKVFIEHINAHKGLLKHNQTIFEILEGDLSTHLQDKLQKQLEGDSSYYAMQRAAPVNVLKKIIDKLSSLYIVPPERITENPQDQELIDWYTHNLNLNTYWNDANEAFNAYKTMALELFEDEGFLKTRSLQSARYLAFSIDPVNPLRVTHFIKIMTQPDGELKFWIYSDTEFISLDKDGDIIHQDMIENEGVNPFDIIPVAYQTRSRYLLVPLPDTDTVSMTLLIPVLLTDLNFASLFLSNPIVWTKNAAVSNMKISPNMYWDVQGVDPDSNPEIGVIKAEPNIESQLTLVKDQLGMWLQTRNIKPGAIGKLTAENAASGISLMIQEMDTTEDRLSQIAYFKEAEQDYWYRLAVMHNQLVNTDGFVMNKKFSNPEELKVNVKYANQKVFEAESDKVDRISKLLDARLISKKAAVKEIFPDMSEEEAELMIEEIKEETQVNINIPQEEDNEE